MSELKAYHCNEWHNEYTEFYLKSEADEVIAKLNVEIKRLMDWNKKETRCHLDIERHSKYKRCLKNAESCLYKVWYYDEVHDRNEARRMWKWRERWFDIAKQFKEAE